MRSLLSILFALLIGGITQAQISITEVGTLPEKVSNNAVCEGFVNGVPYVYSFGGIDTSKVYTGIHLRSFRYNTITGLSEQIPDLPDTLGKIAAAASRIDDIIYISGGYHVFAGGGELSSNRMHRYDIANNVFLSDGMDIPVATDDHVQAVWRDSLIYLITGWSNTSNIPDVQIYNPKADNWLVGTSTPNNNNYKSFGSSGLIIGDTIYYFGGASSSFGFNIQNKLRKGVINPNDPSQITWSISTPDEDVNGYRAAATSVGENVFWIGGSNLTYNYNGIAYNGSGGVPTSNRVLWSSTDSIVWNEDFHTEIPMDLRGIANVNDTIQYLAGGMVNNQEVTDKIYRIGFDNSFIGLESLDYTSLYSVYPNPTSNLTKIGNLDENRIYQIDLLDIQGKLYYSQIIQGIASCSLDLTGMDKGLYFVQIGDVETEKIQTVKVLKF